ncbi:UNVERIFIED_CONTAM: hypothetical protein Sradi_7153700 [Sesamum radiatum]|uniref:Uncharacterized protein n=1 Tax=Sesamum radiatum TaxID=300843 RepID=A0AAW2IXR6_SESRA
MKVFICKFITQWRGVVVGGQSAEMVGHEVLRSLLVFNGQVKLLQQSIHIIKYFNAA